MHTKSGIFSYTLFTVLSRTYSFIDPSYTNRTLKLICYGMKNLTYTSLSIIKSLLYVIYCDSNDVNNRKILCCLRRYWVYGIRKCMKKCLNRVCPIKNYSANGNSGNSGGIKMEVRGWY